MATTYTREEVAKHNKDGDLWVIIDSRVYDLSKFGRFHPGGLAVLTDVAGQDATKVFYDLHRVEILKKYNHFVIGVIAGEEKKAAVQSWVTPGEFSKVPYGEMPAFAGFKSPYYNESHYKFAKACREFCDGVLAPKCLPLEDKGVEPTAEIYKLMGDFGLIASRVGVKSALKYAPNGLPGGIKPEEFDYFHEAIAHESVVRLGMPGLQDGISAGLLIGYAPLANFGRPEIVEKFAPAVIRGEKKICLAITEAFAGSDVAQIRTTAKLSEDGKHYIVNGTKKWITNGTFSDYFVTAVRTGKQEDGAKGVSLLLIERSEGVKTTKIPTSYSPAAGTAYITFDQVKVPVENLLGKENDGFRCIMSNFNHERWGIAVSQVAYSRKIIEECFKWAFQRIVFGRPLIAQPVIREKLALMVAANEAVWSWCEQITYQLNNLSYAEQAKLLAGPIALLKLQSTRVALDIADKSCQIWGGRALTKTGMGQHIERFKAAVKFSAILGGSEEIMGDLGIKQAMRFMPKGAHARL